MRPSELTGRSRAHVRELADPPCVLHEHVVAPFLALRRSAATAGLDVAVASGFRDFDRQLVLWNDKYRGARPVYDATGRQVDVTTLDPAARVDAILTWSALPGASRHHWGTELDLYDRGALPAGRQLRLEPQEYAAGGPFHALSVWLEANAARFGFFRPYRGLRSAVAPEPWHWSFAPIAIEAQRALSTEVLGEALAAAPLAGREIVLARIGDLHARYVRATDGP